MPPEFWVPGGPVAGNDLDFRQLALEPRTLLERQYMALLCEFLTKPRWWEKIGDNDTLAKWMHEAAIAFVSLRDTDGSLLNGDPPNEEDDRGSNSDAPNPEDIEDENIIPEPNSRNEAVAFASTGEKSGSDLDKSNSDHLEESSTLSPVVIAYIRAAVDALPSDTDVYTRSLVPHTLSFLLSELKAHQTFSLLRLPPLDTNQTSAPSPSARASPTSAYGVLISDDLISPTAVAKFGRAVAPLEEHAMVHGNWHPKDNRVLNLVHPSSYCLVYGKSLISSVPGALVGEAPIKWPGPKKSATNVSTRFQWLPAEFSVSPTKSVTLKSYINGLGRRTYPHAAGAIRAVFEVMLPMFESALGALTSTPVRRIQASFDSDEFCQDREEWFRTKFIETKRAGTLPSAQYPTAVPDNLDPTNSKRNNRWSKELAAEYDQWQEENYDTLSDDRDIVEPELPDPNDDVDWEELCTGGRQSDTLAGKDLQVIVKMAAIHLTPENPNYEGGNWHIEGMENEAIAATGIFYYDVENITDSRLTFRNVIDDELFTYQQSEHTGLESVYGFDNYNSANTNICGSVTARTSRCVVFPNFLQHRVEPFRLADPTRPGHRRALALFLVHPENRLCSTAHVPPQQEEVMRDELAAAFGSKWPALVVERVARFAGCMSKTEAKKVETEVGEERSNTLEGSFAHVHQIYLCEH
ncbi:hypothetical protein M427DRAFT_160165 [Gonapodya prolifera JEL478]|uniref:DUF4246 domain-containing protein n=1 Tax=Gonapodya prolifera (strain JEL478) TaxID=1344416 RepID=A0A138ZZ68_GONPJ|nr:hypothetical protein M427DRAFT_160165 [Gonapodya prolifera JEL478]|eukprot:KXS09799.1 hypothetical protein M427DRAFT_160165 [Gonapodya prolifera JEL478]